MTTLDVDECTTHGAPHRVGPDFGQDPYPFLADLARQGPVHRVQLPDGSDSWWVTDRDAVRAALGDHARFSSQVHNAVRSKNIENSQALIRKDSLLRLVMINRDPPDHTRMRKLVVRAFGAPRVEALRPRLQEIADGLLDRLEGEDVVELVSQYAFPMPVAVICELLGIPLSASERLGKFVSSMVGAASPDEARAAIGGLKEFIAEVVAEKRANPGDDVLSELARAQNEGLLTPDELPAMALQILSAGHESSIFVISTGLLHLLTNPEALARARADDEALTAAVHEILRFEPPPVPGVFRHATTDVQIGGHTIPEGSLVVLSLAAANRDPVAFPDPHRFDIDRGENDHLSFGAGIHTCLGARLAVVEATIAIGTIIRRFPDLRLAVEPEAIRRRPLNFLQRLNDLPVRLRANVDATSEGTS